MFDVAPDTLNRNSFNREQCGESSAERCDTPSSSADTRAEDYSTVFEKQEMAGRASSRPWRWPADGCLCGNGPGNMPSKQLHSPEGLQS